MTRHRRDCLPTNPLHRFLAPGAFGVIAAVLLAASAAVQAAQPGQRPNILVIMSDDVGQTNVGLYSHGMMVPTPNIDRIAHEGILFTDHYAQPSCTAGRASTPVGGREFMFRKCR